uniref:Ankyrin repeat and EF-hand domain containing 1a n=1 Tax=Poecilia latipinna TaxID=48699 RepID=A0A3B3TR91_9TELE
MSCAVATGRLQVLQIYRLLQWIHKGEKDEIQKMVKLGVKNLINLTEPQEGLGVLHLAVSANNGVLFYCSYPTKRHARCLELALKNGADPNNISCSGVHVLSMMCEKANECTPLCLALLDAGADPNAANEQTTGVTALMEAAKTGSLPVVRQILRRGGNPNTLDQNGYNAVHYAALSGCFEVIMVLSGFAADMSVINMDNCTPLHYAAAAGNALSCKFLAQRCNPKVKNKEGLLARQIAKDFGLKAAIKELKKAERAFGKSKKSTGGGMMSDLWALTLHDWSNEYQAELVEAFRDQFGNADLDTFMSVLENLGAPVEPDQLEMVFSAHNKKGEGLINVNDFVKGTKYIKKVFRLTGYTTQKKKKEKGAKKKKKKGPFVLPIPICTLVPELKPRRPDGGPPHFMIEKYHNLTDVRRFDNEHPPLHPIVNDSWWYIEKPNKVYININYCVRNGDLESLDLAFNDGVPVDAQDEFYKTPLMEACISGNYELVQYLLEKAEVNMCDQFFWTPLHHAANGGYLEIVELLVNAGADVNAKALNDGTPLMRAIESSSFSCVEFLINSGAKVYSETKKSIILHNTRITTGKTNTEDISFVPKTVWGELPTTSQLMSNIARRKGRITLEVDFDDLLIPFSQRFQRRI